MESDPACGIVGGYRARFHGISLSVLKSWLQKSIRRGDEQGACTAMTMIWHILQEPDTGAARTNILNRLNIIAGEDVCANPTVVCDVLERVQKFYAAPELGLEELLKVVRLLCQAPKARYPSLLRAVAATDMAENEEEIAREALDLHNQSKESYVKVSDRVRVTLNSLLAPFVGRGWKGQRGDIANILSRVTNNKATKISPVIPWIVDSMSYLSDNRQRRETFATLLAAYMCHNESHIFLMLLIGIVFAPHRFVWDKFQVSGDMDLSVDVTVPCKVPEYALDIHTGNKSGSNGYERFAREGAFIENKHEPAHPGAWETVYIEQKVQLDQSGKKSSLTKTADDPVVINGGLAKKRSISEISKKQTTLVLAGFSKTPAIPDTVFSSPNEVFSQFRPDIVLGQCPTAKHKPRTFVYVPEMPGWVVKGPYAAAKASRIQFVTSVMTGVGRTVLTPKWIPNPADSSKTGWLAYPNKALRPRSQWKTFKRSSKTTEDREVVIADRVSMGIRRMIDGSHEEQVQWMMQGGYLSFLAASVIGIGDMGPHNAIVCDNQLIIIDLDDMSGKETITSITDVFRSCTAKWAVSFPKIVRAYAKDEILSLIEKVVRHLEDAESDLAPKSRRIATEYEEGFESFFKN